MYVNGFWFGVITTLAAEFILATIVAAVNKSRRDTDDDDGKR